MNYKYLIVLPFFFFLVSNGLCQEVESQTNGYEEYWEPSERDLLDFFSNFLDKRSVNHHKELGQKPLLIRFESADAKIAHLLSSGDEEKAADLKAKYAERNKYLVDYIEENYSGSEYFFYYGEDADKIFKENKFELLYSGIGVTANDVEIDKMAYVLSFRTLPRSNQGKMFSLHLWDKNKKKVFRLKKHTYNYFWNPFSPIYKSSLKKFCKVVERASR